MQPFHQFTERPEDSMCAVCGLQRLAVAHLRYEACAYDHGFRRDETAHRFATRDEAVEYADAQPAGRVTSFTGRNVEDVTWYVTDLADSPFEAVA